MRFGFAFLGKNAFGVRASEAASSAAAFLDSSQLVLVCKGKNRMGER